MAARPETRYHAAMNCPACKTTMFVMEYDGLELDHCPGCAGVWFDADELDLLFGHSASLTTDVIGALPDAAAADVGTEKPRRCPRCRKTMRKVNIGGDSGVLVDVCRGDHGLFFDQGEVAQLARSLVAPDANLPARLARFLGDAFDRSPTDNETETS